MSSYRAQPRDFVSFADLMAQVGYFMFYWSTLEHALTDGITSAKATVGQQSGRVCGSFAERLDSWSALVALLPENANNADLIAQIRQQALRLRLVRNTIVHGLASGSSMPRDTIAHIVCTVGGYDDPTGETVRYSIDDLKHLTEAIDACRRGFVHVAAFNFRLDPRFQLT